MRVGSLFSGYGGLDMAVGGDLAWYSEIEPAACTVLEQLHPDVPNIGDITAVDWSQVEPVDVITGGYPCQPFSHAGLRKGKNDERHLWPYVRDAIRAIRPRYAILENVRGHLTLGFADVLADLAGMGWDARWGVVRASDAGAPHGRARLFIVAYPDASGLQRPSGATGETQTARQGHPEQGAGVSTDAEGGRRGTRSGLTKTATRHRGPRTINNGGASSTHTNGDGHGQQLHARGMASVESQTEGSPQQRQRARRESDAGGDLTAANADRGDSNRRAAEPQRRPSGRNAAVGHSDVNWGKYAAAITQWERVLKREAPSPTTLGKAGRPRLSPVFVEWMMGLPEGHVTGHGLSAAQELKMLGNGVVPQQAALALELLGVRP